jgi:hypothetical protein
MVAVRKPRSSLMLGELGALVGTSTGGLFSRRVKPCFGMRWQRENAGSWGGFGLDRGGPKRVSQGAKNLGRSGTGNPGITSERPDT